MHVRRPELTVVIHDMQYKNGAKAGLVYGEDGGVVGVSGVGFVMDKEDKETMARYLDFDRDSDEDEGDVEVLLLSCVNEKISVKPLTVRFNEDGDVGDCEDDGDAASDEDDDDGEGDADDEHEEDVDGGSDRVGEGDGEGVVVCVDGEGDDDGEGYSDDEDDGHGSDSLFDGMDSDDGGDQKSAEEVTSFVKDRATDVGGPVFFGKDSSDGDDDDVSIELFDNEVC